MPRDPYTGGILGRSSCSADVDLGAIPKRNQERIEAFEEWLSRSNQMNSSRQVAACDHVEAGAIPKRP